MIPVELWGEVRRLALKEKLSKGQIARRLHLDRKTVRKVLDQERYPGLEPRAESPRSSILDPHKPLVALYLKDSPELSAMQVLERLRRECRYAGEVTLVRHHLAKVRRAEREALLHLTHLPGKVAQVDWAYCGRIRVGDTWRRLSLFAMVLAFSRRLYVEFTLSERMDAFLEAHVRAFEFFAGVPDRLLYDCCKTVVLDRQQGQVRFHPRLLAFAAHDLVAVRACPPRRPWHKGIVESAIGYWRRSFQNGRAPAEDLERERRDLERWRDEIANVRLHAETRKRPDELFCEAERAALTPLPATRAETAHVEPACANAFAEVRFDGNRYSVPHDYAHRTGLTLRAGAREVIVADGAEEIARHVRAYERGRRVVDPRHSAGLLEKRRRAERDTRLGRLEALLGDRARAYVEGLARKPVRTERHLARILDLADRYGTQEVREALVHGLAHGAFGADAVENVVHQRRRAGQAVAVLPVLAAEELAAIHVPEPDLSPYDALLEREGERSTNGPTTDRTDLPATEPGPGAALGGELGVSRPDAPGGDVPRDPGASGQEQLGPSGDAGRAAGGGSGGAR